jgi:capsular polysaccharide biosynthesis protein
VAGRGPAGVALASPPVGPVSLTDYFEGRAGLATTWPGSEYSRRPARLVNAEIALPHIRRAYQSVAGRTACEGVATLHDATILGGGTIRVDDGRFLAESVYISMSQAPHVPGTNHAYARTRRTFGRAIFAGRYVQTGNYAHFLLEVLPRLLLDGDHLPTDVPILLHESARPWAAEVLRVAGIDPIRVKWIGREPVCVKTLYWPMPNTLHPLHHSPRIFPCLRSLTEGQGHAPAHRRLYVSRADATRRRLLNESQVLNVLAPLGFECVVPGRMSFEEQARTFAEAHVVVAICGAGLANMVFMPPGGMAVMLSPSSVPGVFFWDIAHHLDVEFVALWGRNDGPSDHGQHPDFWMDTSIIGEAVAQVLEAAHVVIRPSA